MYSLDNKYFNLEFNTLSELIDYVILNGVDPNYEITKDNKKTEEFLIDHIIF
jgi:hypothetical protein